MQPVVGQLERHLNERVRMEVNVTNEVLSIAIEFSNKDFHRLILSTMQACIGLRVASAGNAIQFRSLAHMQNKHAC